MDPFVLEISYTFDFTFNKDQAIIHSFQSIAKWLPCTEEKCTFDFQIKIPTLVNGKEMVALCTGDIQGKVSDADSKSIFCYSINIPISPSSIVICVGPFESVKFSHTKPAVKTDEEEFVEQERNSRITVFFLSNCKKYIHPSCFFLPQALDFIEQWVGASYPFGSLEIVITDCAHAPIISGATLIVASVICFMPVFLFKYYY